MFKISLLKLPLFFLVSYIVIHTSMMILALHADYTGIWNDILQRLIWETTTTALAPIGLSLILSMGLLNYNVVNLTLKNALLLIFISIITALVTVLLSTYALDKITLSINRIDLFDYKNGMYLGIVTLFLYTLLQVTFSLLVPMGLIYALIKLLHSKFSHVENSLLADVNIIKKLHLIYYIIPVSLVFSVPFALSFELLDYQGEHELSNILLEYKVIILYFIAMISSFILYKWIKPLFNYPYQQLQAFYITKPLMLVSIIITLCNYIMIYSTNIIIRYLTTTTRIANWAYDHPETLPRALPILAIYFLLSLTTLCILSKKALTPHFLTRSELTQ